MTPSLLVCSIFAGAEDDELWLTLQHDYLMRTSTDFDHAVYLSHRGDPALFKRSVIVGRSAVGDTEEHLDGLKALGAFCHERHYDEYLVLDSDAFPIAVDWRATIGRQLARFNKTYAAPVRSENLDTFPHPCVVYTRDPSALLFGRITTLNLLGDAVTDVACLAKECFPMLRTNRYNIHPVLGSIYLNLFYHHGCGSRTFAMRSMQNGYYRDLLVESETPTELLLRLHDDPRRFIDSMRRF